MDRATIFFISISCVALSPAINIVRQPTTRTSLDTLWAILKTLKNRTSRYTPAVTRVDECTKAETGVGADMAAGSQEEKGIWALFVNLAKAKMYTKEGQTLPSNKEDTLKLAPPAYKVKDTPTIIMTSPTRFLNTVSMPALQDLLL